MTIMGKYEGNWYTVKKCEDGQPWSLHRHDHVIQVEPRLVHLAPPIDTYTWDSAPSGCTGRYSDAYGVGWWCGPKGVKRIPFEYFFPAEYQARPERTILDDCVLPKKTDTGYRVGAISIVSRNGRKLLKTYLQDLLDDWED